MKDTFIDELKRIEMIGEAFLKLASSIYVCPRDVDTDVEKLHGALFSQRSDQIDNKKLCKLGRKIAAKEMNFLAQMFRSSMSMS